MGVAIRSLKGELCPKFVCDFCKTTIELDGDIYYQLHEPYSRRLRFFHKRPPCGLKTSEMAPPGWFRMDLRAFVVLLVDNFKLSAEDWKSAREALTAKPSRKPERIKLKRA